MASVEVAAAVRAVTDDEVEFFFENGWVKLAGLVDAETAAGLLAGAKRLLGDEGDAPSPKVESETTWFRTYNNVGGDDEWFRAVSSSRVLGSNAARLFGRDSSIRRMTDSLMVKLPVAKVSGKGQATAMHQDTRAHQFFGANSLNVWLALDEVTPEMGAMQFYSGSQKLGHLGNLMAPGMWEQWKPAIEERCSLAGPVHLQPGDATVHTHYTIHGTDENRGDRPRWAWGAMLLPGDAEYTGAKSYYTDGLGLEPFGQLDHPNFPLIYRSER